ncbi:MAG: DNA-directed DNA polymerase II small subunit [Candidatus Thermoplasmatota archaeon]
MNNILKIFSEHGTFIQPDAFEYISSKEKPDEFASILLQNLKEYPLVLTVETVKDLEQNLQPFRPLDQKKPEENIILKKEVQKKLLSEVYGGKIKIGELSEELEEDEEDSEEQSSENDKPVITHLQPLKISPSRGWKPLAQEYAPEINIIKDITGNSMCEGTTQDFVKLFRDRYESICKIIRSQRREISNIQPIGRIKKNQTEIQLIGMVKTVKTTSNGHKLIELEDETGTATLLALKNNPEAFSLASEVLTDEIIGVVGKISKNGDLIIIQNIIFPDIRIHNEKKKIELPLCAAFLSDIHIGSKMFMHNEWTQFLQWINGNLGNSRQKDVASRIKYLILPGDLVDGIGIYPNQEKELAISNIYAQYEALAQQLSLIPDHITILLQPGNHDAVRPAEPQPTFEKEIRDLFQGKDFRFIGNPCYFTIHSVEILSYHGQSLLDFATQIQHVNYNEPTEAMKIMLKKRHLSPVYGGYTPLAPEHIDYMIIDRVPDIFVTGHVHTAKIDTYRGVTLINASSWQAQTTYQKMLNFVPDSAKLPIVDLKTGTATTMDFSKSIS